MPQSAQALKSLQMSFLVKNRIVIFRGDNRQIILTQLIRLTTINNWSFYLKLNCEKKNSKHSKISTQV